MRAFITRYSLLTFYWLYLITFIFPSSFVVLCKSFSLNENVVKPADFDPMELLILSLEKTTDMKSTCRDPQRYRAYAKMIESAFRQNITVHISSTRDSFERCERWFIRLIRNYYHYKSLGLLTVNDEHPWNNPWVRDYGHSIVYNLDTKQYQFVQPYYEHALNVPEDERFATEVYARYHPLPFPAKSTQLKLELGNLISNGQGKCILSNKIFSSNLEYFYGLGYSFEDDEDPTFIDMVLETLKRDFGCKKSIVLEKLMVEPTKHVDMYMFLLGPEDLVYFKYSKYQDLMNSRIMDFNLEILKQHFQNIHIFEMPDHDIENRFLTYANALQINQELLVPTYYFKKTQKADIRRLERTLDGLQELLNTGKFNAKRVVPLGNTRSIIASEGNIHCLSASWNRFSKPKSSWRKAFQIVNSALTQIFH